MDERDVQGQDDSAKEAMKFIIDTTTFEAAVTRDEIRAVSWLNRLDQPNQNNNDLRIFVNTEHVFQEFEGMGGSFSELGWLALSSLPESKRSEVLGNLFGAFPQSCFSFCRVPIGSSDFATEAYSLNDNPGDYAMTEFSIDRDRKALLPFIKSAQQFNPELRFHASPWSPPGWLKTSGKIDGGGGRLIDTPDAYRAYAAYFRKFVEGYAVEGVTIDRVFIQNEPDSDASFPGCTMPPEQMVEFTVNYLEPAFRNAGLTTGIWGGTYRTITGLQSHRCMSHERFRNAVDGCGFQYGYPEHMADLVRLYPGKKIMHTESVCYNGQNSPPQAIALFESFLDCMCSGCSAYTYWNMVLNHTKRSTWGWTQNSLVTVDEATHEVVYNPDFHVMNLLSKHLSPGARRIEAFCFLARVVAFQNPDASIVVFLYNGGQTRTGTVEINGQAETITLPGKSIIAVRF